MKFTTKMILAAVATIAPAFMHAATISSNPTLAVDGLTFSNFSCTISMGGTSAFPSECSQINVNTTTSPGVGLQISSGFVAAAHSFDDAVVSYHLASNSGVSNIGLSFDGFFLGMGISSVSESVYSGEQLVGYAKVACGSPDLGATCDRTANVMLNGSYNNLYVVKDINVTGFQGVGEASVINQTFTATPEPSSSALLGVGLLGAAGLLRRKFGKVAVKA